jgi:iron complex outermembrane receptor protein
MKSLQFARRSSAAILSGLCVLFVEPVLADSSQPEGSQPPTTSFSESLDEIIVTAQKRAENIQSVPLSITAVSGGNLEKAGAFTANDLQRLAPALTMSTVGSGFVSYTYIRGGGTNQIDPGSDPSVAYFVDEVYIGGAAGLQFDLFDLDHVEVLKGPQGTLFGRNAASGAISIVTRRPSQTFEADVTAQGGDYSSVLLKGSVSGPLVQDSNLLFRVSAVYRKRDGFTENLTGGPDPGGIDSQGVRGQLEWRGDNLTVLLTADGFRARNGQTNSFIASQNVAALVDPTLPEPTNQSFFAHYYNLIGYENQDVYDANGRIEWVTPLGTVTSISAYRHNKFDRLQDQDSTLYDSFDLYSSEIDKTFSQELRLTGDAWDKLHYTGGLYYYHAIIDSFFHVGAGPAFPAPPVRGLVATDTREILTDSYAAFTQLTYDLTHQWNFTLGGRYTRDDKEDRRTVQNFFGPPFSVDPTPSFHAFTPAATLQFKPQDDLMTYLSYRKGYKSGGFQALLAPSAAVAATPFLPEYVNSYEAGVKSTFFDQRLLADIAIFRADITDQQVSRTVNATTVLIDNAGRTRADGVDLTLTAKPASGLTLSAEMTYQRARFLEYQNGAISYAGRDQLRSPDFAGYFSAEYALPVGSFGDLALRGDYGYRTRTFYDQANSTAPGLYAPAYGVGNVRLTLTPDSARYQVSAFVNNVGDTHYYQNIADNGQSGLAVPGEPRTFGAEVQLHFR